VEAVADEAAPGGVEDLPPSGVEVLLRYTRHAHIIERIFALDKALETDYATT
jgi:hypothetical protein